MNMTIIEWLARLPFAIGFFYSLLVERRGARPRRRAFGSSTLGSTTMNTTIYATILTGFGVVITLIVTMHTLAKTIQQDANRRIDDLKQDTKRWIDETNRRIDESKQENNRRFDELRQDLLAAIDNKSRVTDSQFEVVGIRFQKLEEDVAEVRQDVQDMRNIIFKTAA
jgi:hypothetical protein